MNQAGIRYKYAEGTATDKSADFTRHAKSLLWGYQVKPWDGGPITVDLYQIEELHAWGKQPNAAAVDVENSKDFGRALVDIKKAQNLKATSSPHNPTHG
ncbi:MAG: hypothetical protein KA155_08535 [Alphaproteobacteria bacterium]|jgi:hypothetical protein|nr:hypothetical protein [Alphaproteobacteria bacterium]